MLYYLKVGQTARPLLFLLVSSTDHTTPATGKTPTVTLSKNGAAFASPAGAVSEVGSGWYQVAGNATDTGTLGPLLLHATATGADASDTFYEVVAFDPTDSAGLGLSRIDTNIGSRSTYAGGAVASVTGNVGGNVAGSVGSVVADVGITQAGADKVWSSAARTLTSFGTLIADIWANASRTLSAFAFQVTVSTNQDKTGYTLSSAGVQVIWDALTSALTTVGSAGKLLVDNLNATVSSRLAGSAYTAPLDSAGTAAAVQTGLTTQGYTSARAALLANLDATISSRLAASGYTAPPALSAIVAGVLDELLAEHTTGGSVALAIQAAGNAGDPWSAALPSTYTSGQAGYIIGHNLDTPVSTRAGAGANILTTGPVLAGGVIVIVPGDTYQAERGTAIVMHYAGPVDLLTAPLPAVTLTISTPTPLVLPVTVDGVPGDITLTTELSSAQSGTLVDGAEYRYATAAAWADSDTDRVTLAHGPVRARA